jgi:DegV family protein with EDD domain
VSKVQIVTDSAATIEPSIAEQLGITVVPLSVRIDHDDAAHQLAGSRASELRTAEIRQEGVDLDPEELLMAMSRDRIRPAIVGPTTQQFRHVYTHLTRRTDQIISLHSSSSLSLICSEAERAAQEFLGRCDIVVVDSETISLGLSILVQEAARLANASLPLNEVLRQIRGLIPRIYIVLITKTMDYLEHSGFVTPTQAILGTMLGISPFLAIEEGQIVPMEKVRSRERAIDKLVEFAGEFSSIEQIAVLQSTSYPTDETKLLQERLQQIFPDRKFPILLYGPLLASHIGPDGMGLIVYEGPSRGESAW